MEYLTAKLHEWRKHICKPDGTFVFWGFVYDDKELRFPDGLWIHTSIIDYVNEDVAYTKSGNSYLLVGEPSGEPIHLSFRDVLREQNLLQHRQS